MVRVFGKVYRSFVRLLQPVVKAYIQRGLRWTQRHYTCISSGYHGDEYTVMRGAFEFWGFNCAVITQHEFTIMAFGLRLYSVYSEGQTEVTLWWGDKGYAHKRTLYWDHPAWE